MKALLLFISIFCALNGYAATLKGNIFLNASPEKISYLWEKNESQIGDKTIIESKYTDKAGVALVEESAEYLAGKLQKYTYKQLQVNEGGTIEIKDGKVSYDYTAQGNQQKETADLEQNAIIPDMIESHVQKHWDELLRGDEIKVRLMILERQDTIGFKFYLDKERERNGKKIVDLVLKPSSIFIAMVAPNFHLSFEKEAPHRLLELSGSLPIREPEVKEPKKRKDYRAIRARVEFGPY